MLTATPEKLDEATVDLVTKRYGYCSLKPEFFDDFYKEFTSQSAEVAKMFAHTDMTRQKSLLRSGISFLVMYASGKSIAKMKVESLGVSHNRSGYNIRPSLYPLWLESVMRTVKKHDPLFDDAHDRAWRKVLQFGIDAIASKY